jgi:hypothetical protein
MTADAPVNPQGSVNLSLIALVAGEESALADFRQRPRTELTTTPWHGRWLRVLLLSTLTAALALLAFGALIHQLPAWAVSGLLAANFVLVLRVLEPHTRHRWPRLCARKELSGCQEAAVTARLVADDETEALAAGDLTGQHRRLSA